jgi:REP element-mobilizing transposase RayT
MPHHSKEPIMPKPRYTQVSLDATPYYHCVSRCVRRAFLCGTDALSGQCYEHRRQWLEDKLLALAGIFAIDVCAYAIMSNHYHVVLHINREQAQHWGRDEVIHAWHQLFSGNLLSQRHTAGELLAKAELEALQDCVSVWRQRLMDISWFMRVLNEQIARQANAEDSCSGRFWEGRFKSQALLDETALVACMAYVDLNPIRARMARTPEESEHTSIKTRITSTHNHQPKPLYPFVGTPCKNMPEGLPFRLTDYIELVDWTGRILREDKRGHIPQDTPPLLQRLHQDTDNWLFLTRHFESKLKGLVGSVYRLKQACQKLGYRRTPGLRSCERHFS